MPIKHGSHINAELPAVITSAKQHNAFTHQAENVYSFEINVNLVFFNVFSLAQLGGKAASNVKKKDMETIDMEIQIQNKLFTSSDRPSSIPPLLIYLFL